MARVLLRLLGTYRLELDGHAIGNIESDQARALLAYLAVENNQAHPRQKLLGIIWPETDEQHAVARFFNAAEHEEAEGRVQPREIVRDDVDREDAAPVDRFRPLAREIIRAARGRRAARR